MGYTVIRFDLSLKGKTIPVAVHVVTDGAETSHIVSIEGHENFEIKADQEQNWQPIAETGINADLLALIMAEYKGRQS